MPSFQDLETENPPSVKVLVIGASYGGLATALNLLDLCSGRPARFKPADDALDLKAPLPIPIEIKLVDERDGYYHLIGSPLALSSEDYAAKAYIKFEDIPALRAPGISFTQGTAISVNCDSKTAVIRETRSGTDQEESYDFLVASSGLRRTWPVVPQSLTRDEYLSEIHSHVDKVRNAHNGVVVIGGGAVGIEMASELKLVEPEKSITLIHSRERLLSSEPLPDEFKDRSFLVLQETGVKVMLNRRVMKIDPGEISDGTPLFKLLLDDGSEILTSHVIKAISHSIPTTSYLPEASLDLEGYVKIGPTLNFTVDVPNARQHFAVGDIAAWSGIKRCGGAMYMGFVAAVNIHQQLLQKRYAKVPKFEEIPEFEAMIALAVGKKAVLYGPEDGTTWGESQMKMMFGDDLGFSICWNYLKLGVDVSNTVKSV